VRRHPCKRRPQDSAAAAGAGGTGRLRLLFSFSHVTTVFFNSSAKKIVAAYRAALRPRLLVLVALVGAAAAYSSLAPEPLNGLQASALLGGFLTYKAGQFVSIRFLLLLIATAAQWSAGQRPSQRLPHLQRQPAGAFSILEIPFWI